MDAPQEPFYIEPRPETLADLRAEMSRRGDFGPSVERYANEANYFEVLTALEALAIEDEVLA